jgi:hypothetical protein
MMETLSDTSTLTDHLAFAWYILQATTNEAVWQVLVSFGLLLVEQQVGA